MIRLIPGDCLDVMGEIEPGSVHLILADLPYGTTACKWDVVIPFEPLWAHYRRLLAPRGAIVLTASQPFTSMLVTSNPDWFRYAMVWDKVNKYTGFLNVKARPLRRHEDVLVFAAGSGTYNPQMIPVQPYRSRMSRPCKTKIYGEMKGFDYGREITEQNPCTVIDIPSHFTSRVDHPTQKPVALGEYLIKTYSNSGDTVLDNTMGSGSFGVAAVNCGRAFIGIEKDLGYFEVASRRIAEARHAFPLFTDAL